MSAGTHKTTEFGLLTVFIAGIIVLLGMILGPRVDHAADQVKNLQHPTPTQTIYEAVGDLAASPFALVLAALFIGLAIAMICVANRNDGDQS